MIDLCTFISRYLFCKFIASIGLVRKAKFARLASLSDTSLCILCKNESGSGRFAHKNQGCGRLKNIRESIIDLCIFISIYLFWHFITSIGLVRRAKCVRLASLAFIFFV